MRLHEKQDGQNRKRHCMISKIKKTTIFEIYKAKNIYHLWSALKKVLD